MAGKKSLRGKGSYAAYEKENRVAQNKKRKLERHLKRHPNDKQTESALSGVGSYKGRSAPKRMASRTGMEFDEIFVKKGKNFKSVFVPRSINTSNGRISTDGKLQQQFMRMKRKVNNVYKFLGKNKKQLVGDELVDGLIAPRPEVTNSSKRKRSSKRKKR